MTVEVWRDFRGMVPLAGEGKAESYAELARNARFWTRELDPIRDPLPVAQVPTGTRSIYPLDGSWLAWTQDVQVTEGPVENDVHERLFYTGHYVPKVTTRSLASANFAPPAAFRKLGLPAPDNALTASPSGGSGTTETRAYQYRFRTEWGESGPWSPASSLVTGKVDDTWALSGMDAAPPNDIDAISASIVGGNATIVTDGNHFITTGERVNISETAQSAPDGATFNGSSYMSRGALSGAPATATKCTIAIAFRLNSLGSLNYLFRMGDADFADTRVIVSVSSSGSLNVGAWAINGLNVLSLNTASGVIQPDVYYRVLASWEQGVSDELWINGVDAHDLGVYSNTANDFDSAATVVSVGAAPSPSGEINGSIRGLYVNIGTTVDFSDADERAKFFLADGRWADMGADGSTPTGAAPLVWLPNAYSTFHENEGTGGDFTVTGELAAEFDADLGEASTLATTEAEATRLTANSIRVSAAVSTPRTFVTRTVSREAPIHTDNMTKEIYRSTNSGDYQFVAEIPAGNTTYNDTVLAVDLGNVAQDNDYLAPPTDMHSIRRHPAGFLVGISGNVLCRSELFLPHAWPTAYRSTLSSNGIGCEVEGNNIVVATETGIEIWTGVHPGALSPRRPAFPHPCRSRRSIKAHAGGVSYVAESGLVRVVNGVPSILTRSYLDTVEMERYPADTILGAVYEDRYIAWFTGGGENGDENAGFMFSLQEGDAAMVELDLHATAAYEEPNTSDLYMVVDDTLQRWDAHSRTMLATFLSQERWLKRPAALTAARVRWRPKNGVSASTLATALAGALAAVEADHLGGEPITTGAMGSFMAGQYPVCGGPIVEAFNKARGYVATVTFQLIADDEVIWTEVVVDEEIFRIDDSVGKKDAIQVFISCRQAVVEEVVVASSPSLLSRA